jgi:amino-acid N-acetyltransferase
VSSAIIRKARISDAPNINALVNHFATKGLMLPKRLVDVYEHIREFWVAIGDQNRLLGCGGLRLVWNDLAEVRSLAIAEEAQGMGIGRRIVEALISEAYDLGLGRLFALTYQQVFFEKLQFHIVERSVFPQKVWLDCRECPKQECCDEIAMLRIIDESRAALAFPYEEELLNGRPLQMRLPVLAPTHPAYKASP